MNKETSNDQLKSITYFAVVLVWAISTGWGLFQSVSEGAARYNTSELFIRGIQVFISLPLLFIYLSVAFAAVTFLIYTSRITNTKEHKGYKLLTTGLFLTLASYLVSGILGIIQQKLTGDAINHFIIARNAVTIILGLITYGVFYQGSRYLLTTLKSNQGLGKLTATVLTILSFVGVGYVALVFQNPYRTTSATELIKPTYALPDTLILTTVILPYILTWMLASLAVTNLLYYSKNVGGLIFKSLFNDLALGFGIVISLTIVMQFLGQFSDFWSTTGLQGILVFIFGIFLALVVGYILVGKAARKLDRIETV